MLEILPDKSVLFGAAEACLYKAHPPSPFIGVSMSQKPQLWPFSLSFCPVSYSKNEKQEDFDINEGVEPSLRQAGCFMEQVFSAVKLVTFTPMSGEVLCIRRHECA